MRRQFQHQPEEVRREALIAATLDAVAELGLAGTTVREVADRAGVTPGLIRRYFDNKDTLIQQAYRCYNEIMVQSILSRITTSASPENRLKQFVKACCTAPVASPRNIAIWAAFITTANKSAATAAAHRDGYQTFRTMLATILTQLWTARGVSFSDGEINAQAIVANSVVDGFWLEISLDPAPFEEMDAVAMATNAIFAALGLDKACP